MKYTRIKAAEGRHPHPHPHASVRQQAFNGTSLNFTSKTNVTPARRVFDLKSATVVLKLREKARIARSDDVQAG